MSNSSKLCGGQLISVASGMDILVHSGRDLHTDLSSQPPQISKTFHPFAADMMRQLYPFRNHPRINCDMHHMRDFSRLRSNSFF